MKTNSKLSLTSIMDVHLCPRYPFYYLLLLELIYVTVDGLQFKQRSTICIHSIFCLNGRVHTESSSLPDSSEPYVSGRLRVGFAFTLLTTDPTRTVRVRFAVYKLRLLCDRLCPNYIHVLVLNSWHTSRFPGHNVNCITC